MKSVSEERLEAAVVSSKEKREHKKQGLYLEDEQHIMKRKKNPEDVARQDCDRE